MTLVYLSGPMTGLPQFNYPKFNRLAKILRDAGLDVLNPAENFDGSDELPRPEYIRADIKTLLKCDGIVVMDGWESSAGARLEIEIAKQLELELARVDDEGNLRFFTENDVLPHAEAESLVHGARQGDYGHPLDDFSKTALIWSAILGVSVTAEQVGLCMVGVKLSREVNKPKRDNIVDAHGYLMTYEMVKAERNRRGWYELD